MIDTGVPLTIAGSDSGTGGQSLLNWDWHKCLIAGSDREQSLLNWYDTGVPLITGSVGQGAEPVKLVWHRCPSDHYWLRWWDRGTEHVTLGLTQMSHWLSLAQTVWEGNRACWTRNVAFDAQFRVASHPATSANQTTTADIPCENLQGKRPGVELSAEPSTTAEQRMGCMGLW